METNSNEKKYTITINPTPILRKPTKPEMGKISNNLTLVTGLTINEYSTYSAQPYGYAMFGGTFSNTICNDNWESQSVFALDFDKSNITIEHVLEKLNQIEINPQLWYTTFRDTSELPRFRVVFFLDEPVRNIEIRNLIVNTLLEIFPDADTSCRNAGRFYLGGKQSYILSDTPISLARLVNILAIHVIANDSGKTRKLPASLFKTSTKSVPEQGFLYNINRSTRIQTNSTTTPIYKEGGEEIDFDVARKRIKILDSFLSGNWLYHDQLFGLATNLYYVKGGRNLMRKTMLHFNEINKTFYSSDKFYINTYLNKKCYAPQPIHSFSKFPEDSDLYDLISSSKDIRGHIEQIETINKISLEDAQSKFQSKFEEVMNDKDMNKIHLFILPTAIGKTHQIRSSNGLIALPTNDLKREVYDRMEVPCIKTPDAVLFENEILNRRIDYYYSIGIAKKATAILYEVINPKNISKYSASDIEKASQYLLELNESYHSNKTVLTTHSRAIHSDFNHETIIFDEDPLSSLVSIKQVAISDLQKLDNQSYLLNNDLANVIEYLKMAIPGEVTSTPVFDLDLDALMNKTTLSTIQTNIFDFFCSSYILKDKRDRNLIHYIVRKELPKNKKIIILSATLPIFIYEKLYGERLNVIDIRDVEQKGEIIQYTNRSCSRQSLSRYVSNISQEIGSKPVITFKAYQKDFVNPVEGMYFGNCSGSDRMKGQDLAVVGTPHRNNSEYLLFAKILGIDFKTTDTFMEFEKIDYNGFRFKMNCYLNEELRSIQLSLIESDLIQAVGRARTLRTDAKVELYSNFPLRISSRFVY